MVTVSLLRLKVVTAFPSSYQLRALVRITEDTRAIRIAVPMKAVVDVIGNTNIVYTFSTHILARNGPSRTLHA
jgi:hypothetical protein